MATTDISDDMLNWIEVLARAKRPMLLCHPDRKNQAQRIAEMFLPRRVAVQTDEFVERGTLVAIDRAAVEWKLVLSPLEPSLT